MVKIALPVVHEGRSSAPELPSSERRSGPAKPTHEPNEAGPRPPWLKARLVMKPAFFDLKRMVKEQGLHTVCESASCPNIGECWSRKALTFMILGNVCTRSCGFCDVMTGRPGKVDEDEPRRVAQALSHLGLRYAVVTSVDRDDLKDGGARIWAETIRQVKAACPEMGLEVLTPDFKGVEADILTVVEARPDVFAHNIETVERLHARVRPQARYDRSLKVMEIASKAGAITKSGVMLGLGEAPEEVVKTMRDLRDHGCQIVNLGQYLRPSERHLPIARWATPEEFDFLRAEGLAMGLRHVEAGALVRSSYRADMQAEAMGLEHAWRAEP
jgi:lipoic acid synthetase